MKLLFICLTLCTLLSHLSAFVLQANTINEPDFVKFNATLSTLRPKSRLCMDEHGKEIFGNTAYKLNCRKFVQCGHEFEFIGSCQAGLLYNKARHFCDWPRDANCIEFPTAHPGKLVVPDSDVMFVEVSKFQ